MRLNAAAKKTTARAPRMYFAAMQLSELARSVEQIPFGRESCESLGVGGRPTGISVAIPACLRIIGRRPEPFRAVVRGQGDEG